MTLLGWRAAHVAGYLDNLRLLKFLLIYQRAYILPYYQACFHIVATNGGCIAGMYLTIETNHGNASLLNTLDGLDNRFGVYVGSHNQQVDARLGQTVYLASLQFGIVIRIGDVHLNHTLIQVLCCQHLLVHLITPAALRALRYANLIGLLTTRTSCQKCSQQDREKNRFVHLCTSFTVQIYAFFSFLEIKCPRLFTSLGHFNLKTIFNITTNLIIN